MQHSAVEEALYAMPFGFIEEMGGASRCAEMCCIWEGPKYDARGKLVICAPSVVAGGALAAEIVHLGHLLLLLRAVLQDKVCVLDITAVHEMLDSEN